MKSVPTGYGVHWGVGRWVLVSIRFTSEPFDATEPSAIRGRRLDAASDEAMVGGGAALPASARSTLVLNLVEPTWPDEAAAAASAIRKHFAPCAADTQWNFAQLLRLGRISLAIGLLFLGFCIGIGISSPELGTAASPRSYRRA